LSWYALRVTYSRELKIQQQLREKGIETFVPMIWRNIDKDGKKAKKLVPAINNLCFVRWTYQDITDYIKSFGDKSPVHFYWDRTSASPLIVPDKAMEDFMKVSSSMDEDLIYITEISDKLREGQTVRVKEGAFAGVEGKVVRIKKSRRILVELPGMLAVATTYVSPSMLEIL
jgi:transcription antitermination factor NusG